MMSREIVIALAGNPNSGKTTLFNRLTGARQHVGNYPGVTVEKKEGRCFFDGHEVRIIDLPGTYSLTAYSMEELVARNYIIDEKPDVVVDVVDASNLERNLYLATQLIELGVPLLLAFNMSDVAAARGLRFDLQKLSRLLGVPIVPTIGHKGTGIDQLLDMAVNVALGNHDPRGVIIHYGREIDEEIEKLQNLIEVDGSLNGKYRPRWLAVKLLENDGEVRRQIVDRDMLRAVDRSRAHIHRVFGDDAEILIPERRYGFISGACQEAVASTIEIRHTMSDSIDAVVAGRLLGIPIFLGLMYLTFQLTFSLGDPVADRIEFFFAWLAGLIRDFWPGGSESPLRSLLVDGVIGGVGGVVVFLPNIMFLFLAIAILEDSGYMARAAFIMDRLMHKIGLHGKSFIPMLIGFGCSVPAIMATRTLQSRRDRLTTMLIVPLMSCGARLPIYALIIPAFFPQRWHAPVLMLIYLIGILLAVCAAKILRATVFQGESSPFVMELPPYRLPTIRGVVIHMWERARLYLRKAGTIILGISIVLWFLTSYPKTESGPALAPEEARAEELAHSFAGRIGHTLEPLLRPLGFDWKIGTALIGAFAAKEVFVAQMGIVYSVGDADETSESLREQLRRNYNPLVAFCIMLFCLISTPCMATFAVVRRESGSWRWAFLQLGGLTVMAYFVTFVVYQIGSRLIHQIG